MEHIDFTTENSKAPKAPRTQNVAHFFRGSFCSGIQVAYPPSTQAILQQFICTIYASMQLL
jgi:hypothetical protein